MQATSNLQAAILTSLRYSPLQNSVLDCEMCVTKARTGGCMITLARRLSFCFLFLSVIGLANLSAQVQATNGSIQGDVTDSAGAAVPGADVEANAVDTGTENKTVTDGSGHFGFPSLKPGRYQVKVSKTGFATTIQQNLTLTVGLTASLKLTLRVQGTTESVVVESTPQV